MRSDELKQQLEELHHSESALRKENQEKNDLIAVLLRKAKLPETKPAASAPRAAGHWWSQASQRSAQEDILELERIVEDTTEDNIRLRNDIKIMSDELRKVMDVQPTKVEKSNKARGIALGEREKITLLAGQRVRQVGGSDFQAARNTWQRLLLVSLCKLLEGARALRKDSDFLLSAIGIRGSALSYAAEELQENWDFVMAALKAELRRFRFESSWQVNVSSFAHASPALRGNRHLVEAKVRGGLLPHWKLFAVGRPRSLTLANSAKIVWACEIVLAAVDTSGFALQFASPRLQLATLHSGVCLKMKCAFLIGAASRSRGRAFQAYAIQMRVVRRSVARDADSLAFADPKLQGDKSLVLEAVRACPSTLEFASPELRLQKSELGCYSENW
ncbi:unnamed protein product [Symbiodinium microadriaticum]|nr:unnamed protein product [Symbiodinium microadriaticum]